MIMPKIQDIFERHRVVFTISTSIASVASYCLGRELFQDFYETSNGQRPSQIIIFRDGVSETQFNQVLTKELDQIIKAYHYLGEVKIPKFTVIVAQKKHRTKFFQAGSSDNVPPGTVVDTKVVHPTNYDFYMSPHAGMMGTSRPAHYHVLLNEIGFSPDELQNLIHSLSCVNQRSSFATSIGMLSYFALSFRYNTFYGHLIRHFALLKKT